MVRLVWSMTVQEVVLVEVGVGFVDIVVLLDMMIVVYNVVVLVCCKFLCPSSWLWSQMRRGLVMEINAGSE